MNNPLITQGILNKVITSVNVPGFPLLQVTAPFMAKAQVSLSFDGQAVEQPATATGVVQVPQVYQTANLTVNLLRSQSLINSYTTQWQTGAYVGQVDVYTDSTTMSAFSLSQCSIANVDPGTFNGDDPSAKIMFKGILYVNASMWTGLFV